MESNVEYKIVNNSFKGISPDDLIADHKEILQVGKINDGEKGGEGFIIEVSGQELGYVMPNKEDKRRIGNITIQSAEDVTEEGIKVGDMFKDALTKYPNLKVKRGKKW